MVDVHRTVAQATRSDAAKRDDVERKFVFGKCCFFVPLRTGCLIIAYIYMMGTFANIAIPIYQLIVTNDALSHFTGDLRNIFVKLFIFGAVSLCVSVTALPFNILLLVGLHQEKRKFVKVFAIFQVVFVVINSLQAIVIIAMGLMSWHGIFILILNVAFNVYYVLVLRSQYVKMGGGFSEHSLATPVYRDGVVTIEANVPDQCKADPEANLSSDIKDIKEMEKRI